MKKTVGGWISTPLQEPTKRRLFMEEFTKFECTFGARTKVRMDKG